MKEILLTSSALILALLVLRRLFRKVLSRRVQYALWGLVLLRLLVPAECVEALHRQMEDATCGRVRFEKLRDLFYADREETGILSVESNG